MARPTTATNDSKRENRLCRLNTAPPEPRDVFEVEARARPSLRCPRTFSFKTHNTETLFTSLGA
eukprot:scaffold7360_cov270-Pinguiococcus_pyrenoidosus.AAC.1